MAAQSQSRGVASKTLQMLCELQGCVEQQRSSAIACLSVGQPASLKCQNLNTLKFHNAEYASSKVSVKGKPMGGVMKVGGVKVEVWV